MAQRKTIDRTLCLCTAPFNSQPGHWHSPSVETGASWTLRRRTRMQVAHAQTIEPAVVRGARDKTRINVASQAGAPSCGAARRTEYITNAGCAARPECSMSDAAGKSDRTPYAYRARVSRGSRASSGRGKRPRRNAPIAKRPNSCSCGRSLSAAWRCPRSLPRMPSPIAPSCALPQDRQHCRGNVSQSSWAVDRERAASYPAVLIQLASSAL